MASALANAIGLSIRPLLRCRKLTAAPAFCQCTRWTYAEECTMTRLHDRLRRPIDPNGIERGPFTRADRALGENPMKDALHVATLSGWRRFERSGEEWRAAGSALMYWSLTCLSVDPENPQLVYAGSEHSGLFYTTDGGKRWLRAKPNVPKLMLFSVLALPGTVMAGTIPAALYRKNGGGWEELEGVRLASSGATFPPSPELQSRTRYLAFDPRNYNRLYAGIEVGGLLISDDAGKNWRAAGKTLTDPDVHEVLASRSEGLVLAACGDKAFRSRDRGESWEEIT